MEYKFKKIGAVEVLRTKADSHTNLSGFQYWSEKSSAQTVTHYFHIVCKTDSKEDAEGRCYDWYVIDNHYCDTDKSEALNRKYRGISDELSDAICEMAIEAEEWRGRIEDAMCELAIAAVGGE